MHRLLLCFPHRAGPHLKVGVIWSSGLGPGRQTTPVGLGNTPKERDILEQEKRHMHCVIFSSLWDQKERAVRCGAFWRFLGLLEAELFLSTASSC